MTEPWELRLFTGLVYGCAGCGKTPFAAQLPKPIKVFQFEPLAKAWPYLQQGRPEPVQYMDDGGAFLFVRDPETKDVLVEIECFFDANPAGIAKQKYPCAYERFQTALQGHMSDNWKGFASAVLDSYPFCEIACSNMIQYKINPAPGGVQDAKHNQMQWAGETRGVIQTDILCIFPWIPIHSLVLAHVDDQHFDKQEKQVWGVSAIGKLGKILPGPFAEVYHMYTKWDAQTQTEESWFETREDQYIARSGMRVPSPCKAEWEALWKRS
jgi:hypothetical protein